MLDRFYVFHLTETCFTKKSFQKFDQDIKLIPV
jgi:hypothetical protein